MLALFGIVLRWYKKEMEYRRTVYDLQNLTNRDLADLGISRSNIEFVARESSNKKFA